MHLIMLSFLYHTRHTICQELFAHSARTIFTCATHQQCIFLSKKKKLLKYTYTHTRIISRFIYIQFF